MKKYFEQASAQWVRYSAYEWKKDADGTLYLTAAPDAQPEIYDPLKNAQRLVLDALNIGRMGMSKKPDANIQAAILRFAGNYGLLGLMTALPTTATFMEYEAVYLPKNRFLKEETMKTEDYLALFFPFAKPDVVKRGIESAWRISDDRTMMALAVTMNDQPMAVNMSFQREYAERYDWLKQQFVDWAFTLTTSVLYYMDYDQMSENQRDVFRKAMTVFDGNTPTYHIALRDKPTIVWDFHSLLLAVQLMFSFMLADEANPLRICKGCGNVFVAGRKNEVFCSPECKNRYNVSKSREKK